MAMINNLIGQASRLLWDYGVELVKLDEERDELLDLRLRRVEDDMVVVREVIPAISALSETIFADRGKS